MDYAVIQNDVVVNVAVCDDPAFAAEQGWRPLPEGGAIGWKVRDGVIAGPTKEEIEAEMAASARRHRDHLLATEVDPIVTNPLRWTALTADQQAAWSAYRQALLEVPDQTGFPMEIVWPDQPA